MKLEDLIQQIESIAEIDAAVKVAVLASQRVQDLLKGTQPPQDNCKKSA